MNKYTKLIGLAICLLTSMNTFAINVTIDDISYSLDMGNRTASVKGSTLENVVVPETIVNDGVTYVVISIASDAFSGNKIVKSIKTGNTIKEIGGDAFHGATNLKKIQVGKMLTKIGNYAFYGCFNLKYIVLPATISSVSSSSFENTPELSIICLKQGFDTGYSNKTIYPKSFFTFNNSSYTYNGNIPIVNYTFNGIGNGFQPTEVNMESIVKEAGKHTAILSCSFANDDMSFDVDIPYTYIINPVTLTAKVKDAQRLYGDADPQYESTYTGFVNGEDASVVTSHGTYSTEATATSDVGTYAIKQSGATAQNYVFEYEEGTLTVNKAPLTMTANDKSITYGNSLPTFDVTYTGLKNNETKPKWVTEPTITTSATTESNAGTYLIEINDADATNYTLTTGNGTLTINKAALSIKADRKKKLYCELNPELTYSCEGFVKNETDAVLSTKPQLSTTAITNSAVGVYPIEISGAEATNYSISYQNSELEIQKRTITASVKNYTRAYGEENPIFEIQYSGFVNDEDENVLIAKPKATTDATASSDVGEYSIVVDNGVAENYDFIYNNGILTIEKAYQTLKWEQDLSEIQQYAQIELTAEATSGLPITYSIEGPNICSITQIGNKQYLDCFEEGETVIIALQEGNQNYWKSVKIYKTIVINGSPKIKPEIIPGDANSDGVVNVTDIVEIVNDILGHPSAKFDPIAADVNGDGQVNVTDIVSVVNIILSDPVAARELLGDDEEDE